MKTPQKKTKRQKTNRKHIKTNKQHKMTKPFQNQKKQ